MRVHGRWMNEKRGHPRGTKRGVKGVDVALKIKEVIGDKLFVCPPLQSRVSVKVRDIDLLDRREDMKQNIASGLRIKDASEVEVKSLKAAAWGMQTAIAVVPASYISGK